MGALLIGHSSASIVGLTVITGLIDADYTGEIQIMAQTLFPPLFIPAGSRIAQLIPLSQLTGGTVPLGKQQRGEGGFGSTGTMALLTVDLKHRPKRYVDVQYQGHTITLAALLDTGADVSIIGTQKWPPQWPTHAANATVAGVGGLTLARRSPLLKILIEGKTVTCTVSVIPLPEGVHALLGRDVLAQLGMVLTTDLPL